jgi:uncharacterized glyoxalase superfamily protein PhnB
MYLHVEVSYANETIAKLQKAGYSIIQEPRGNEWGTEAFVADPDGYAWALISWRRRPWAASVD